MEKLIKENKLSRLYENSNTNIYDKELKKILSYNQKSYKDFKTFLLVTKDGNVRDYILLNDKKEVVFVENDSCAMYDKIHSLKFFEIETFVRNDNEIEEEVKQ